MTGPTFRIKPYAHPKYKFVVRAKLAGKWKRSYFKSEAEAAAYAGEQNASLEKQVKRQRSGGVRSDGDTNGASNWHELEKSDRRSTVSSQALSRKAVVVLGMHRSGTSALCGALDVLGVNFGKHLMPANEANPKGYWEHLEIVRFHDDLLRALGSHWDDDRPLPADWLEREVTKETQSCLLAILQRDFGKTALLGLKDPRMSRLMPLWFPLFEKLGIEPYFVLVVRHPSEVAQSLAKRDGLDHARSYLLWLQHTLEAETVMRRHKRSFIDYDEMLDDPVAALGRVRSELKLDFRVPSRARASLRKFLEPSLRHHKGRARKCEMAADRVPPLVIEVYEAIRKGTTPDDVARRISPLREQLTRSAGLFYPRLNVLERQVESLDQRVEKSGESASRAEELVRLDIFRAVGEEYSAAHSDARYFMSGSWKLLQIDLPGSAGAADKPLRIDPVTYPAVIDIAEMALKRPSTGEILWAATGSTEFAALTVGGTACRLAHELYLRILSFGNDPQLLLPQPTTALGDSPLRLELSILVDGSPEAISASLAEMQRRALEERTQLARKLEATHAQAKLDRQQIASLENELRSSQRAGKELQAASAQLSSQLEAERAQNEEQVRNIEKQKNVAESELKETRRALQKSRDETARFSGVLEIQNSNRAGLALYNARLQNRLEVSRGLLVAAVAVKHGDPKMPAIADSILEDIERIRKPSLLWKAAKAFGVLRFAQPGVPRTAADRRAIARELKAAVREISKAFSSATTAPEDAVIEITRLLDLRRKAREIVHSVNLSTLLRLKSPMHGERRPAARFSEVTPAFALFDAAWYLGQYPEVAASGCDPLTHYLRWGAREGRDPNPVFNTAWYLANNPNVAAADLNPLEHYFDFGAREGRDPSPLFSNSWYLAENGDVAAAKLNPLQHYLEFGAREGRDPHPLFSTSWYLAQNPEIAGLNPLEHYLRWGCHHGRSPHPLFDCAWYLEQYPDVASAGLDPLQHYLEFGARAGRNPHPLFDSGWYMRQDPALKAGEVNPLQHYVLQGADEGRSPHPFFDCAWYREQYPDVAGFNPLEHYVRWGCHGRSPHPLFDCAWYLEQYPDVASAGLDPLQHYLKFGARAGRDPSPLFDSSWYLEQNPDLGSDVNPLRHYLEYGALEGRDPHPLFSASWYLAQNPEVAGRNPLEHYLRWGCHHGRSPHPLFDCAWYLEQYPDVASASMDPFEHYLKFGARAGRDPSPLFDSSWYLEQNPDLGSDVNPLRHYLEYGALEGRDPHPLFDSTWYMKQNPPLEGGGVNPLQHYVLQGADEGRSPHPLFDSEYYRTTYLRTANDSTDPWRHYLTAGSKLGYRPNPHFDPQFYLRTYPDVGEAGMEPLTHYVRVGKAENRVTELLFEPYRPDFEVPREPALPTRQSLPDVKAIAFYLPQFHRIPENDAWWGEGFTEWTNVRRGRANFADHYQPHVPSELGYYDLGEHHVLEKQTDLARAAGIHGFCFYYYWFAGRVLLDLPVRRMVETGKPEFPFCICWANENWTRRWDGRDDEILIAQQHSPEDDLAFIQKIEPILSLKNYIRVEGKPMLLVYRPSLLPEPKATLDRWRQHARKAGLGELHLVMVRSFSEQLSPESGFDAVVQFPPFLRAIPVTPLIPGRHDDFSGFIYNYTEVRRNAIEQFSSASQETRLYPGVMPSWDNTARQQSKSTIWVNSSPEAYCEWLAQAARLVRLKVAPSERFVFINAWNEWGEGCHLEPDERFGYAWLNATSLALREPSLASLKTPRSGPQPEPPVQQRIEVKPLAGPLKLVISVLLYYREDIIPAFLRSLLPQLRAASAERDLSCELFLSLNYKPTPAVLEELQRLISEILPRPDRVHIIENGFNLGFGAGHNAIFEKTQSDVFIVLNSDLEIQEDDWLDKFIERFRTSDAAIIGLTENASRLREDGCGVPVVEKGAAFDFVDGSVLAIRSDLASRFGLFSPPFDYFYFEDVDLNLRYQQMGLRIDTLDIGCIHERSSSSQLLPAYAVESVLDRNRTRFLERWRKYLTSRTLENRLAVRFRHADRQLQCASLPAIFGLLGEHPTAILDLWGVHEQLVPLFEHERIRLIPSWQTLPEADYLRFYEIHHEARSECPRALEIAEQMLVDPDFEQSRMHLTSLVRSDSLTEKCGPRALFYLARQEVLFAGKQPDAVSFLAAQDILKQRGFWVQCYSEYGIFEVESATEKQRENWKYTASSDGLNFLTDLAQSEVLVTSDGWAAELGQLLDKRTFLWLGATSVASSIWNDRCASSFIDDSLGCLGCHHRFGTIGRNICLRGDVACMRESLKEPFAIALNKFLDGHTLKDHRRLRSSASLPVTRLTHSEQETLEAWPRSSATSVLVLTPVNPNLDKHVLERARILAERAISGMRECRIVYDDTGESPQRGTSFPHRLAVLTPLRQAMIERHLRNEQWVFWVDADLAEYPANLIDELIGRAEGGMAAPLVLMEGNLSEPAYPAGFGPGRFYDIAGFVENGRWARFTPPYFDQLGPVYQLDSVGCCYLVNADLYRHGARHELDHASSTFITENRLWKEDAICQNQRGPANSFSDHYTVCQFARKSQLPVRAFADLIAYHERPSVDK
ncbi:MAG TPA: glycoside hydrolase family 99-like domain-containing protein [Chthoniobacterales bacterium]|nr:glycoside hydrolase family 99-like domain-containing protein [Chthoniobacterales bacterium]